LLLEIGHRQLVGKLMRALAIFILFGAFVTAVIMPNEIGTQDLPATGSKCLKAGQSHPLKGKAVGWIALCGSQSDPGLTTDARQMEFRRAPTVARRPISSPLLI